MASAISSLKSKIFGFSIYAISNFELKNRIPGITDHIFDISRISINHWNGPNFINEKMSTQKFTSITLTQLYCTYFIKSLMIVSWCSSWSFFIRKNSVQNWVKPFLNYFLDSKHILINSNSGSVSLPIRKKVRKKSYRYEAHIL